LTLPKMAYRNSNAQNNSLVAYDEPEIYVDEPEQTGRTGIRNNEQEVDYSVYTTRKKISSYVEGEDNKYRKVGIGLCICCCCCLLIAGLITGIVLALKGDDENPVTDPPSFSSQPSGTRFIPPTFPPTFDTQPTASASPTKTVTPSQQPSSQPTTSAPSMSSQPTITPPILKVLGEDAWERFGTQYSFIVNDQGLYNFVMEFKHDENLPMGDEGFTGNCAFSNPLPTDPIDGLPIREPRRHFKRLPDYVWKATGFQHLSLDWNPCGKFPIGFATPHYDFSFFRVRPEYRAYFLECDQLEPGEVAVPGVIEACRNEQTTDHGKEFYILPASIVDRSLIPNMPTEFTQPDLYAPAPYVGMQYYDVQNQPSSPDQWNDLDLAMSTHAGDLMMWQARVPYRLVNGTEPQFHSRTQEYFQSTIQPLPDAFSVYYKEDGVIRFEMTGISEIGRLELDSLKLANPDNTPSAPSPVPDPPTCVCVAPDPTPFPSRQPSVSPSMMPSIPSFDSCSLLAPGESNLVINCFSSQYECNEADVTDCEVECASEQCLSSEFSESYVKCISADSCIAKNETTSSPTQFIASQVLCQEAGSCADAVFLACTCCDGVGCPTENFLGDALISCIDGDIEAFCSEVITSLNSRTCKELGNPVCTNLII
jgi:hypothetical protein